MSDEANRPAPPKVVPQPKADGSEPSPLSEADIARHERRKAGWRSSAARILHGSRHR